MVIVRAAWALALIIVIGVIGLLLMTIVKGRFSEDISAAGSGTALPPRPREIIRVHPSEEASEVSPTPEVGVDLRLTEATRKEATFDISTVGITLDGEDVTGKAKVRGTMDHPQSRVTLVYRPEEPLSAGKHVVSFSFASERGRVSYGWRFSVSSVPCP